MTETRRRLAYVTQWFAPEPTAVPIWVAEALEREGWDVTVLTGIPNYPDGVVKDGYRAWRPVTETHGRLPVMRAPLYPSHDGSAIGRVANYMSWAISSAFFGRRALRESDVVLVYSSPATAAFAAVWARLRHQRPYVLLVQDLWPDSIFASGFLNKPAVRRLVEPPVAWFVRQTYHHASAIAVIAPGMRRTLLQRGVAEAKINLVYNWVDELIFHPADPTGRLRATFDIPADVPLFLYGGNIGAAQGLEPVVDAFLRVGSRAHLVLVGDGIRKADLRNRAASARNIHFHDPVPIASMTQLQADADVLVVSLTDDPLFAITLPSKTQASLAAGRAVLAVATGDVAEVVTTAEAGVAARPGDVDDIVHAIDALVAAGPIERARLGECGRTYYTREMGQDVGARRLSDLLAFAARSTRRKDHA